MLTFIKDCILQPTDFLFKTIDSIYIRDLELLIKEDFQKVKKGEKPISEFRETIVDEISHVLRILNSGLFVDFLDITSTDPLLRQYSSFLIKTRQNLRPIIEDPEYWKMRESRIGENTSNIQNYAINKNIDEQIETPIYVNPEKSQENIENHYIMIMLKKESPLVYNAIKNGFNTGIVKIQDDMLNFKCAKGCIAQLFIESGYSIPKTIKTNILANGEKIADSTWKNAKSLGPPKEWEDLKHVFYPQLK